mgnify:FL=1
MDVVHASLGEVVRVDDATDAAERMELVAEVWG